MDTARAQEFIVVATLVTVGSTGSSYLVKPAQVKKQIPDKKIRRTVLSGFAAMFICSVIAEANAELGLLLAVLISGGIFIEYGLPTVLHYYEGGAKK